MARWAARGRRAVRSQGGEEVGAGVGGSVLDWGHCIVRSLQRALGCAAGGKSRALVPAAAALLRAPDLLLVPVPPALCERVRQRRPARRLAGLRDAGAPGHVLADQLICGRSGRPPSLAGSALPTIAPAVGARCVAVLLRPRCISYSSSSP
jgi:hypothetical protein